MNIKSSAATPNIHAPLFFGMVIAQANVLAMQKHVRKPTVLGGKTDCTQHLLFHHHISETERHDHDTSQLFRKQG